MLNHYEDIITIDELCEILMIGKNCAYRLLTENKIKALGLERYGKSQGNPSGNIS